MKLPELLYNENQRISALYQSQLLDSIREDSFDAITMITAQTCDMPVALICLVDTKRVWIKSQKGLKGVIEIPRNIGFCSHTIAHPELLEIKDATVDERFHDNPLVTEHYFQYYAGVPLTTIDGLSLGTLCVMDKRPRVLSTENKEFLKRMAFTVAALIEARINSNKESLTVTHLSTTKANYQYLDNQPKKINVENLNYAKVFIIDEDQHITITLKNLFVKDGLPVEIHTSPELFLKSYRNQPGCLITETNFSSDYGLMLQEHCKKQEISIPIIFITGQSDISTSVTAMRAGAIDFLEKPLDEKLLLDRVHEAIDLDAKQRKEKEYNAVIQNRLTTLTAREKEVLTLLVVNRASLSNKNIAEKLAISRRTVEVHRSTIMAKLLANSRLQLLDIADICGIATNKEN